MGLRLEITLVCIINLVWIQLTLSDELSAKPQENNWTCTCSIARHSNSNFLPANCSSSCVCSLGESIENKWTCICSAGGFPKLVGELNGDSCFTACNCNAGTLSDLETSKKRISSKAVVIALLVCVVLTALAFIASILWFIYRKDKSPVKWISPSSDRLTSCGSGTNLMSQSGASSVTVYKGYLYTSENKPFIGCIPKASFLFKNRRGGTITGTSMNFSYSELEIATNKFSDANLVGVGGSSHVYRGSLKDGRIVAVKRMKTQGGPDEEHLFLTEIELISRLHHCHVVPLIGYCLEHKGKHAERLLVFEYIPNGNLRECLDTDSAECLDWSTRIGIALGAARGLEYLHEAAAPRILHRDVKSTNILLDDDFKAKITDLGMAKHLRSDGILSGSSSPARMQGTFGYFAPEYAIVGRASLKSDVFSFGVVLLELITGRTPIYKAPNKAEESLVIWATPRLKDSKRVILELPDPRMKGSFEEEEMQVMAYLAKECLLLDPDSRPNMTDVVQILSTIAPRKSKRKHLPLRSYQCSSGGGMRSDNPEPSDEEIYNTSSSSTEEIKQITSEMPARGSLQRNSVSSNNNNLCTAKNEGDDLSSAEMEKLMLLSSKTRSWRLRDDDVAVDLTEPRFESFCLPNVDSHIVEIT
ncbi:hypothetical protein ABFS82_04G196100 [Erythranthe guttata]|uniref:non-specific serine/threonine protein kinase n=1 Tax=Erythranthe guttata TaxID=4155 RepID=A0A022PR54_ERYGU|nr:PREDICTED: receptor-like serine/threonine-protein kinase NCRK [Erythranthe guttata]EYU18812.1 hypothetical protein MIMGU_mgv1a002723mg [Erythranthe guttata]|eukprot:XP_012827893.1 PREDICTED: receptor-like serine/threonine-protein kinase NCRK [Erythranthe guttata]